MKKALALAALVNLGACTLEPEFQETQGFTEEAVCDINPFIDLVGPQVEEVLTSGETYENVILPSYEDFLYSDRHKVYFTADKSDLTLHMNNPAIGKIEELTLHWFEDGETWMHVGFNNYTEFASKLDGYACEDGTIVYNFTHPDIELFTGNLLLIGQCDFEIQKDNPYELGNCYGTIYDHCVYDGEKSLARLQVECSEVASFNVENAFWGTEDNTDRDW